MTGSSDIDENYITCVSVYTWTVLIPAQTSADQKPATERLNQSAIGNSNQRSLTSLALQHRLLLVSVTALYQCFKSTTV